MALDRQEFFIGNEWRRPASAARFELMNASTGESFATAPEGSKEDIDAAVAAARKAFDTGEWPKLTAKERGAIMTRFMNELA